MGKEGKLKGKEIFTITDNQGFESTYFTIFHFTYLFVNGCRLICLIVTILNVSLANNVLGDCDGACIHK